MLTEAEKKWLERRKNLCARCEFNLYDNPCIQYGKRGASGECPGFYSTLCAEYNFVDAADFEARVAANLAIIEQMVSISAPKVARGMKPQKMDSGSGKLPARPTTTSTTAPALPCVPSTTPASPSRLRWRQSNEHEAE